MRLATSLSPRSRGTTALACALLALVLLIAADSRLSLRQRAFSNGIAQSTRGDEGDNDDADSRLAGEGGGDREETLEGAEGNERVVVLGMAVGLEDRSLAVFTRSFALHAPAGATVVLFSDKPLQGDLALPSNTHVVVDGDPLPAPWGHFHPSNARYFVYWRWLRAEEERGRFYDKVLMADVRDVFFQGDPFRYVTEPALYVFLEASRVTVGNGGGMGNYANRDWIAQCYGETEATRLGDKQVINSGVTMGTGECVLSYLDVMVAEMSARPNCSSFGVDQGVHNVLIYSGRMGEVVDVVVKSNEDGPVATLGFVLPSEVPQGDAVDQPLRNGAGDVYAIVHQFDRHKELMASIRRRMGVRV